LAAVAIAPAGAKASSHGRASDTPAARRKWRRHGFMAKSSSGVCSNSEGERFGNLLLVLGSLALDDLVNQRSHTVILVAELADDGLDFWPIRCLCALACGIGQQLYGQGAGDLVLVFLVVEKKLLELVDVTKLAPIREHVGGVHLRADVPSVPARDPVVF